MGPLKPYRTMALVVSSTRTAAVGELREPLNLEIPNIKKLYRAVYCVEDLISGLCRGGNSIPAAAI
jgi:hypothetical protein